MADNLINGLFVYLNVHNELNNINGVNETGTAINGCIEIDINCHTTKGTYTVYLTCATIDSTWIEAGNANENIDHDRSNDIDNFPNDTEKFKNATEKRRIAKSALDKW